MDGIICIRKPQNVTSFVCCAMVRRILGEKKVGHAGTLDPMATGVLPVLLGKATRALDFLPTHDKRYTASLQFGYRSDTLDVWGEVTPTGKPLPTLEQIEAVLPQFRGEIAQIPPMTSALKHNGQRLYDLARAGIEVERPARRVTIYALEIVSYDHVKGILTIDCACSKGTYIRSICDDLGTMLGCGAVMTALERTQAAGFGLQDTVPLSDDTPADLLTAHILPIDAVFAPYPRITVTAPQSTRFANGGALSLQRIHTSVPQKTPIRVYAPDGRFLGLGQADTENLNILKLFI